MIYAWIGAVVVGLSLGLLGSGGAILVVPILVFLLKHEPKQSIAEGLAIVGIISLVGACRAALRGGVDGRAVILFGIPGMVGALAGSQLAHWVPGAWQIGLLGVVMLVAAAFMLRSGPPPEVGPAGSVKGPHAAVIGVQGAAVGLLTGLVGVGGGFLIVPALVLLCGLPMSRAIGTSLSIIALNCAASFVKYQSVLAAHDQRVDVRTILVFGALGVAGSIAGSALGARLKQRTLRRVFAVFLVLMGLYIVLHQSKIIP